jgi:hypothetical protein
VKSAQNITLFNPINTRLQNNSFLTLRQYYLS